MLAHINEEGSVAGAANATYGEHDTTIRTLANDVKSQDKHPIHWDAQTYKYKGLAQVSSRYGETEVISEQI